MIETLTSPAGMTALMIVLGLVASKAIWRIFRREAAFLERVFLFGIVVVIFGTFWRLAGI